MQNAEGKRKKEEAAEREGAGRLLLTMGQNRSFLNNKVELLANNTNIPPGGEVPFMILFYDPPENVAEFGVKIVDVKDASNNF